MQLASRKQAEETLRYLLADLYRGHPEDNVIRRIRGAILSHTFDYDARTLMLEFPVEDWMTNSRHVMHGGIIAICADVVCGVLSRTMYGFYSPTVTLSITYLRAAFCGDAVRVTARAAHLGHNTAHFTIEVVSRDTGALLATASDINFTGGVTHEKQPPENAT